MQPPKVAFGGDLRLVPLFDLGQLLRLNGATGCLRIQDGERNAVLYFEKGDLVNAVDETLREGEQAAIGLFGWRSGTFEFQAEAQPSARVIQSGTEAIMMEAARRLDEAGSATADEPGTSETRRLKERSTAMEALRDVFRLVAGEADQAPSGMDALATTVQLYELTQSEDRLIYQPGHPPHVRRRGRWARVPQPPLTRGDYEELRARLLDTCDPIPEEDRSRSGRRLTLADGRALALDLIQDVADESMWLRPVGALRAEPAALDGDLAGLTGLLGLPEALVLVGAGDLSTARRLLETTVGLAVGPADTLVVVSRDGGCRPSPENGMTLHLKPTGLRAALDAIEPEVVALDPGLSARDLSLEDLASVPRIFAGMVGHNVSAFPARWFLRMAPLEPAAASAWFASMLAGIVSAPTPRDLSAALSISTWAFEASLRGGTPPAGEGFGTPAAPPWSEAR